jgi:hypothetical protein
MRRSKTCILTNLNSAMALVSLVLAVIVSTVNAAPWRFAVVGDTHIGSSDTVKEMIPFIAADSIKFVLVCGDLVEAGLKCTAAQLQQQLIQWQGVFAPLYDQGIGVFPVRGNHEDDAADDTIAWNAVFGGSKILPQNGPNGEMNLTYSFQYKNALCVGLDNYVSIHHVNQPWLDQQLAANTQPHLFVFGHEPAFKVFHTDCLDDDTLSRTTFWQSLTHARSKVYFCGHDHFFDMARLDDNDGDTSNDLYQCLSGGGGGWRMTRYNYNGANSPYQPIGLFHAGEHGYILAEVSGEGPDDRGVTLTWKQRAIDTMTHAVTYEATSKVLQYMAPAVSSVAETKSRVKSQTAASIKFINGGLLYNVCQPCLVAIDLIAINGRHVATLENRFCSAGAFTCRLPATLPAGIYLCSMKAGTAAIRLLPGKVD